MTKILSCKKGARNYTKTVQNGLLEQFFQKKYPDPLDF
jgi:hypothetical protein